jgi:hypothetical protein
MNALDKCTLCGMTRAGSYEEHMGMCCLKSENFMHVWPAEPEPEYYIQHRGFCGDCLLWWRIGRCGYTVDLNQALKVTEEEAANICRSRPNEDFMRLASMVDGASQRHVNSESLPEQWKR